MNKEEAMKLALEVMRNQGDVSVDEWIVAEKALREALAEQPAQQCKWPTCQSEEYQQALAEQIKRELVGEQPARPYRQLQDNGSKYFGESWDKAEQPAQQEPEYAWPTVADYERDVGFETNQAFRMAWNMARTTNKMLGIKGDA